MIRNSTSQDLPRPLEGAQPSKPLHVAVGHSHSLLLLSSPLLISEATKKSYSSEGTASEIECFVMSGFALTDVNTQDLADEMGDTVRDHRIAEMVKSLNLGKEGEKFFAEANISYEVLQHLTKDDLQVRIHFRFLVIPLPLTNKNIELLGTGSSSFHKVGSLQLYSTSE